MKYIDEYRDKELIMKLAERISSSAVQNYTFMEVCGGHTAAIHRFGIPSILPDNIRLISGPGCPVCVTGKDFIDRAVACSERKDVIITTFGDLIRVPGSSTSLEKQAASGADIRIVFSGLEALNIAKSNPQKNIIFLGIGFETTAPGTAVTIKQAAAENIDNFFVLSAHKVMPPAMEILVKEGTKLDGFICPGHVAAITGSRIFNFLPEKYKLGCVVTGFEPADLLQAILMLILQVNNKDPKVEIQYARVVTESGNLIAQRNMNEVFIPCDDWWRGFGMIPASGLTFSSAYSKFNAEDFMPGSVNSYEDNEMCICADVLRGLSTPDQCTLFEKVCSPENPVGACMVSGEGSCNTWYKYKRGK